MDSPDITQHTRTPRIRQKKLKKTPLARIYSLLISRLSTPLLTSLLLLPVIPASSTHTHNATFELVPFYKSLRCLVYASPHTLNAPRYRKDIQQWLSYWTLYSFIRFLEATRCNVSTGEERKKALLNAIDVLPKLLKERISKLFSTGQGSSSSTINKKLPRPMTLATQIAGSPTRWTIIKAILLFYAMDEELQGARRIMQKIIKPIFGFFTSLDEDEDDNTALYSNDTHDMPASRTYLSPEREGSSLKLSLEEKAVHNEAEAEGEDEPIHTPSTPELSMDGSYGGSDEGDIALNDIEVAQYVNNDAVTTVIIKQESTASRATWPLETIAVEGNHWVH